LKSLQIDVDTWSALAAVVAVQFVIFSILVVKYKDDILDVFVRNRGEYEYTADGTTKGSRKVAKKNEESKEEEAQKPFKKTKKSKNKKRHLH